jgi:hypothetical protein
LKSDPASRLALAKLMLAEAWQAETPEIIAHWEKEVRNLEAEAAEQGSDQEPE